ncbi:hypothetical protein ACOME3_008660 [Neoechinorhynchus agilis]
MFPDNRGQENIDLPSNYTPIDPTYVKFYEELKTKAQEPQDGDIRLIGGRVPWEGHPLIYHNEEWRSVCQDGFDHPAAAVTCKQIGYKDAHIIFANSKFDGVKGNFWLDNINCYGNETKLADCYHTEWGAHNCDQTKGAGNNSIRIRSEIMRFYEPLSGVRCTHELHWSVKQRLTTNISELYTNEKRWDNYGPPKKRMPANYKLKLVGGRNSQEGRILLKTSDGKIGSICGNAFGIFEAGLICKAMGLLYAHSAVQEDVFFGYSKRKNVIISGLKCSMKHKSLSQCTVDEDVYCPSSNHLAGVICTESKYCK